jgi:hypothetical protein
MAIFIGEKILSVQGWRNACPFTGVKAGFPAGLAGREPARAYSPRVRVRALAV